MNPTFVKICGLTRPDGVDAALRGDADFVGFVFCPPSPRHLDPEAAFHLAQPARGKARIVAVTVNPTDADLDDLIQLFQPDILQLHGAETPERVAAVKARGLPVIKALPVSSLADLDAAEMFAMADYLLFDAKPPKDADRTGGHGLTFDWTLLAGRTFSRPWFLSGGLTAENLGTALVQSGASALDVSSGVEKSPGIKDPEQVTAFLSAARSFRRTSGQSTPP